MMSQMDFWCRILGWLQILGGLGMAALILIVGKAVDLQSLNTLAASLLPAILIVFLAVPPILSGLCTLLFARAVTDAINDGSQSEPAVLRVFMGLFGLWAAGVVGIFGLSAPQAGFFAILGLITTALAIVGAQRTATLLGDKPGKTQP